MYTIWLDLVNCISAQMFNIHCYNMYYLIQFHVEQCNGRIVLFGISLWVSYLLLNMLLIGTYSIVSIGVIK